MRNHLGFGNDPEGVIQYFREEDTGYYCLGEKDRYDDLLEGRGISIDLDDKITIGYWTDGY